MLYVTKAPPARSPSLRPAAPKQRAAAKAAPPAAKPKAEPAARRRQLRADVATALGAPPPPRASRTASSTRDSAPAKAAAGSARGAASSTKVSAPAKTAAARKQAAPARKSPVPLPAPRQAPPKVTISFPALPTQVRAARYQDAREQQADLNRYRRFLSTAKMVGAARTLTTDERHAIEVAEARINEIRFSAWSSVR